MKYKKPPLSISDQIKLLQNRGLHIPDVNKAEHYLSFISYYRFRAYTYPFQDNSDPNHPFLPGTNFDQILDLYVFDRELRLLVLDAIERVEIALRTQIIYQFAISNGSHWHENAGLFNKPVLFKKDMQKLKNELSRTSEVFIKHYYSKYTNPPDPPAWMSLEVVSLGTLSKLFENLKMSSEKKAVAKELGLPHPYVLESWMHAFTNVRNICAHHSRLWNRKLTVMPKLPRRTTHTWLVDTHGLKHKPYIVLSCLLYILDRISPGHQWRARFKKLLSEHPSINTSDMGFPSDWHKEKLWR